MRRIEMVTLMKAHQPPLPEATMIGLLHGLRGSVCVMGIVIKTMKKSPQILDIDDLLVVEVEVLFDVTISIFYVFSGFF